MRRLNPHAVVLKKRLRVLNLKRRSARATLLKALSGKKVDDKAKIKAIETLRRYKRTSKQTRALYKKKYDERKKLRIERALKRKTKREARDAPKSKKTKK